MEKFTLSPENLDNTESLNEEVSSLGQEVTALKDGIQILVNYGFEAFKTVFKK